MVNINIKQTVDKHDETRTLTRRPEQELNITYYLLAELLIYMLGQGGKHVGMQFTNVNSIVL